jgi:hypothetical protein
MDEQALADLLSQLGPEGIQQMIDAGLFSDRSGLEAQKTAQGVGLMQTPGAQGQNVGGTYVASSPLEHLATALSRVQGGRMVQESQGRQADLIGGKGKGMEAFLMALARQAPVQPQQTPEGPGIVNPYAGMWPKF